eukprot:366176-Chlamydomonas_euryale.AAC.1
MHPSIHRELRCIDCAARLYSHAPFAEAAYHRCRPAHPPPVLTHTHTHAHTHAHMLCATGRAPAVRRCRRFQRRCGRTIWRRCPTGRRSSTAR